VSPARVPAGTPVSQAFGVPAGPDGDPLRLALHAIDRVHGDGALPPTFVRRRRLRPSRHGYYDPAANEIAVNDGTVRPALTMLHEAGHVVDLHSLGGSSAFASASDALFDGWRRAVEQTHALQMLLSLVPSLVDPDKARYVRYLLLPEEVWARSYAQYIVTRSAIPELRLQLDTMRQRPPGQTLYIPRQWEDGDFSSVATEIDRMFERRGWII
jgi:hypothetical protein